MALITAVAGALIAAGLWTAVAPMFEQPSLQRVNVHGRDVPTAGGLVVVLAVLVPVAALSLYERFDWSWLPDEARVGWGPTLVLVLGLGLLGMVDDVLGDGDRRGFRGHLTAMAHGKLTTGGLKLVGGGIVAFIAVAPLAPDDPIWRVAIDVTLVALAANLANLFDRAPGRVTKVALLVAVALVGAAPSTLGESAMDGFPPVPALFVVGAGAGVLLPELRERLMLGDTGANVIGGALGLGAVAAFSHTTRFVIAVVLLMLNLASERVSFSAVIASTPGLRQFDQLGRARE